MTTNANSSEQAHGDPGQLVPFALDLEKARTAHIPSSLMFRTRSVGAILVALRHALQEAGARLIFRGLTVKSNEDAMHWLLDRLEQGELFVKRQCLEPKPSPSLPVEGPTEYDR